MASTQIQTPHQNKSIIQSYRIKTGLIVVKILICSFYNNGLGDLSFGDKLANQLQIQYPEAEIEIITSSTKTLKKKAGGYPNLDAYNETKNFKVKKLDEYLASESKPPDIVVVGPTLTAAVETIASVVPKGNTPIVLMTEYDFGSFHMEDRNQELKDMNFTNITQIRTGLGAECGGIFVDHDTALFDKTNMLAVNNVFTELTKTKSALLQENSPVDYVNSTDITVSYSHNNAEKLLNTHALIVHNTQNADLIIMGEKDHKDKKILAEQTAATILERGFSKIIYQDLDGSTETISERDNGGPVYRVIHTGNVAPDEAVHLRKIGGQFSGATGDQSYGEAIANSSLVLYECQAWKADFVAGMERIALEVDPSAQLKETMTLLSSNSERNDQELSDHLQNPMIQASAQEFRQRIIHDHCLNDTIQQKFGTIVENLSTPTPPPVPPSTWAGRMAWLANRSQAPSKASATLPNKASQSYSFPFFSHIFASRQQSQSNTQEVTRNQGKIKAQNAVIKQENREEKQSTQLEDESAESKTDELSKGPK